jgi:phosphatidylserine/phosphatidylglycerophosphate/cardiolipin synthase-like enzyme
MYETIMIDVYFSPGINPQTQIITDINNAVSTIDLALSYFTDQIIWYAIEAALARGVIVRLLLDRHEANMRTAIYKLYIKGNVIPGLTTRITKTKNYMHNHFAQFDGDAVLTGSYNWTYYAAVRNYEDLLRLQSETVCTNYLLEFINLWNQAA